MRDHSAWPTLELSVSIWEGKSERAWKRWNRGKGSEGTGSVRRWGQGKEHPWEREERDYA